MSALTTLRTYVSTRKEDGIRCHQNCAGTAMGQVYEHPDDPHWVPPSDWPYEWLDLDVPDAEWHRPVRHEAPKQRAARWDVTAEEVGQWREFRFRDGIEPLLSVSNRDYARLLRVSMRRRFFESCGRVLRPLEEAVEVYGVCICPTCYEADCMPAWVHGGVRTDSRGTLLPGRVARCGYTPPEITTELVEQHMPRRVPEPVS